MAINKTLKEYSIGVDAGWLMACNELQKLLNTNSSASLQDALVLLAVVHKPTVTLEQIIANAEL